jgi:hypothetical protein
MRARIDQNPNANVYARLSCEAASELSLTIHRQEVGTLAKASSREAAQDRSVSAAASQLKRKQLNGSQSWR